MSDKLGFRYYLNKVRDVNFADYLSVFPMLAGRIASPFFRKKYADTWAIGERRQEARDNGYHLFRYITQNHPEQKCVYAIDRHCPDYDKVKDLGPCVQYGSVRHWIIYFTAKYLISSQSFKPNGYMGTLIERMGWFHPKHVFLQHGITKDKAEFLLQSHRPNVKYFITGAAPEQTFVSDYFGYPEGTVQYTGFARFDALHSFQTVPNRVLVMPTWRKWLKLKSEATTGETNDVSKSEYFIKWKSILTSSRLNELIEKYNLEVIFIPHSNMLQFLNVSEMIGPKVHDAKAYHEDLQGLMKSSQLLITDYSSVFFDMFYMKKPVIFYQFDEKQYREHHYEEGWFDYHDTDFARPCSTEGEVLDALESMVKQQYAVSEAFLAEHARTFTLYDSDNCARIYTLLKDHSDR